MTPSRARSWRGAVWSDAEAAAYSAALARSTYVRHVASALRRHIRPARTMLDVGAGDGRFAVVLTCRAGSVTAVEPCAAMRRRLVARAGAARRLRLCDGSWEQLPNGRFDLGFAANIGAFKSDAVGLYARMRPLCRRMAWVVPAQAGPSRFCLSGLAARHLPDDGASPVYLDVLRHLGRRRAPARVIVREWAFVRRFASTAAAAAAMAEWIVAAGGTADADAIRNLVAAHARPVSGGGVTLACPKASAILIWDR